MKSFSSSQRGIVLAYQGIRFEKAAVGHKMSLKMFRETLGIIGIESLSFLCDRMFKVMDTD